MPQSKEVKNEQARLRMEKMRNKGNKTQNPESVTLDVTQYPAIIHALTDPDKRKKLEKITQSLKEFKQAENVYYGASKSSIDVGIVGELLEVTQR